MKYRSAEDLRGWRLGALVLCLLIPIQVLGKEFDVTQPPFGARADGTADDTQAIQRAIDACDSSVGGTVFLPAGRYLVNSVVLNRPNLTLRAAGGAVIVKMPPKVAPDADASPDHVFKDTAGVASGLSCYGLKFDLNRSSFIPGNTVSAFFLIRASNLRFVDCEFKSGIEEGLKLYKCQDVIIDRCRFENLADGGVQIHALDNDGYTGTGQDQDSANVMITQSFFKDIDDGLWGAGNGCGVMIYNTSERITSRDVIVQGNIFHGCLRGVWSEAYHLPTRRLMVQDNIFVGQYTAAPPGTPGGQNAHSAHGAGFINNLQGAITGNTFRNIGTFEAGPPTGARTSDIVAILVGGSDKDQSTRFVRISDNVIVDDRGKGAMMDYGIIVRINTDISLGENQISGATESKTLIAAPPAKAP